MNAETVWLFYSSSIILLIMQKNLLIKVSHLFWWSKDANKLKELLAYKQIQMNWSKRQTHLLKLSYAAITAKGLWVSSKSEWPAKSKIFSTSLLLKLLFWIKVKYVRISMISWKINFQSFYTRKIRKEEKEGGKDS